MNTEYITILKRVGAVLLVVGLIDIAVMFYCMANRISYSSSFNLFAVAAGIFLLRANLRAASLIRWIAVFMLATFVPMMLAWPFMQPFSLTLLQVRLNPGASIVSFVFMVFAIGLLFWTARELGREPIMSARASAGRKQRDMRIPVAVGVVLVIAVNIFLSIFLSGESADQAKSIAQQQVGSDFRLHVSSLSIVKNGEGKFVSGVVTAWNEGEIRYIPVRWKE